MNIEDIINHNNLPFDQVDYLRQVDKELQLAKSVCDSLPYALASHKIILDEMNNPVDYEFLFVNSAFTTFTSLEGVIGRRVTELLPDFKTDKSLIERYARVALSGKSDRFDVENLGKVFSFFAYSSKEGEFDVLFEDVTDERKIVSDLKKEHELLLEKNNIIRKIFNSITDAVVVVDIDDDPYKILFANETAKNRSNKSCRCYELSYNSSSPCDINKIVCPIALIKKSQKSVSLEHEHIGKNGEVIYYETHAYPVYNKNNDLKAIIEISRDITARKHIELELKNAKNSAEKNNALQAAFLANMSHEIRTPLNVILGFTQLLKEGMLSSEESGLFVDRAERAGNNLLKIINDVLDISKIKSGQLDIHYTVCNINEYLETLYEQYDKILYKDSPVRLIFDNKEEGALVPDVFIKTDRVRFEQVLGNFLSNAYKFTEKGSINMGYLMYTDHIEFYVSDSGIGIPADKQDVVFERFGQVNSLVHKVVEGTGLGLAISKQLVELLGGEVSLESQVGKGSIFSFTHPYTKK